jgi:pyrimidine operon attenuation protein/uracil phosphoribosyltransferase
MQEKAIIMDENAIKRAIARITFEILEKNKGTQNICLIGMVTRGEFLAKRIAQKIKEVEGTDVEIGSLDITNFRDDRILSSTYDDKSRIDFDVTNKKVVLVDDVVFTGRSVRAAIDAIMVKGRPKSISLAILIDRGHRELPIRADFVGKNLPTSTSETVKVCLKEIDKEEKVIICE